MIASGVPAVISPLMRPLELNKVGGHSPPYKVMKLGSEEAKKLGSSEAGKRREYAFKPPSGFSSRHSTPMETSKRHGEM